MTNSTHASACTPDVVGFIGREMQRMLQYGFRILLPAADIVRIFGERIKLSRIAEVLQAHLWPRLILNLSKIPHRDNNLCTERADCLALKEIEHDGINEIWK